MSKSNSSSTINKIVFSLVLLLLAGCQPASPTSISSQSSTEPQDSPTTTHPNLLPITNENVGQLEVIDQLGIGHIYDVAVSREKQNIAVYTASGIYLYESSTLEEIGFIELEPKHKETVTFSPDGNTLAFSNDFLIVFWNISTWQEDNHIYTRIPDWSIRNFDFSPDGSRIVVKTLGGYRGQDGIGTNFALYDLNGYLLFDRYYWADYTTTFYHFDQEGNIYFIYIPHMEKIIPLEIHVVDLTTGTLLASSKSSDFDIPSGDYSLEEKGATQLLPSKEDLQAWRPVYYEEKSNVINEGCDFVAAHSHDEYIIIYSDENKALYVVSHFGRLVSLELWDQTNCEVEREISYSSASEIIFSPDGNLVAANNGYDVYVWDMESLEVRLVIHGVPFKSPIDIMTFNSDGTRVITSTYGRDSISPSQPYGDYLLSVWDSQTGMKLREIDPNGIFLKEIVSSSDQDILMAKDNKGLNFWDIKSGELLATIPGGAYAFDADGIGIWVTEKVQDGLQKITLFDFRTGEIINELGSISSQTGELYPRSLIISANGTKMAILYFRGQPHGDAITVFDLVTQEKLGTSEQKSVWPYILTGGNKSFFVGSYEENQLWPFDQDEPIIRFPGELLDFNDSMFISRQGAMIYFWDIQSGVFFGEVRAPSEFNRGMIISPNGLYLAAYGDNGVINIWGVKKP